MKKSLKIKKPSRFSADYIAELMAMGIKVNVYLGELS